MLHGGNPRGVTVCICVESAGAMVSWVTHSMSIYDISDLKDEVSVFASFHVFGGIESKGREERIYLGLV